MRTFKFVDDDAYKFWKIELSGTSYTVTYGRIGGKGRTTVKSFATPEKAKAAYEKIIAEKLGKGYIETTPVQTAPKLENTLEMALFANPDDIATHAAYADWLGEQGDPRGEFIQVQLQLEDPSVPAANRKKLQKRVKEAARRARSHMARRTGGFPDRCRSRPRRIEKGPRVIHLRAAGSTRSPPTR